MSDSNGFRHQDYASIPAPDSYEIVTPSHLAKPDSPEFGPAMSKAGMQFKQNGVQRIILVHGTLAGTDAFGWYGHWQRLIPGFSAKLKRLYKRTIDGLTGDKGNYTNQYAALLRDSINHPVTDTVSRINVERFEWSSENHHLGRADAAVRLADHLLTLYETGEVKGRVMLWGHSHAGNVFALLTNLLGENPMSRAKFFNTHLQFAPDTHRIDFEKWHRLANWFQTKQQTISLPKLDIVTFGTPIRYGWDLNFEPSNRLLHFVNHRTPEISGSEVNSKCDAFRSQFPTSRGELKKALAGEYGDFVQQLFIARSDFPPAIWSTAAWKANRILRNLFEGTELSNKRLWRFQQALRVADTGNTLLVDYANVDPDAKAVCGHAVYTESDWLAFHATQVATHFYDNTI